ncbi:MAG TPA: flagellar hook-associated protein FlgK [Tepidisphaeraceae bacterium]|jgi:flagellar hook-associated protein 1 FlgK|nr:flagellar hook-associated protein FlgK [Tepidisphaeraceae bacterium]
MSLVSALNIGRSALAVHQAAIQVTSNNVANAGNTDYTRQTPHIVPASEQLYKPGVFLGSGLNLDAVQRQIDESLQARIRTSISDSESAASRQQWLSRVETIFHELGDDDLSSQLSTFFNSWSDLANKPQDIGLRQIVIQNGDSLAGSLRDMRTQLDGVSTDMDKRLTTIAQDANSLADQVAYLNDQISTSEAGAGASANALRDQRDAVLGQLSKLMDIKTQETGDGMVNVLVGSDPLVLGKTNRGVGFKIESNGNELIPKLFIKADNGNLNVTSGTIGGLLGMRAEVGAVTDEVNSLAANLIFELNKLHSSGQGLEGLSQITAGNAVADTTAVLNSSDTNLDFTPTNGSFVIHVKQKGTGLVTSTLVNIDLDGLNNDDATLDDLRASLDGINGISATISAGKLKIQSDSSDVEFSFSQDSSGVLAALGVNSFFKGTDAHDIAINTDLKTRPSLLSAAKNGQLGDNQAALAIAGLETTALKGLNGSTIREKYDSMINGIAVSSATSKTNAEAASTVQDTLLAQREALSGVSLDEEAVNLIREQRAFQGAARIISAIDELMKTILNMI